VVVFPENGLFSVSDTSASSSAPSDDTLYDPPDDPTALAPDASEDDTVALRLSLPAERAQRLRTVAQQLGLPPSVAAKRAIELVCGEVVTIQDDTRPTRLLIDQYQARLDLLHSVEAPEANGTLESPDD
jgi:hypothetical protein